MSGTPEPPIVLGQEALQPVEEPMALPQDALQPAELPADALLATSDDAIQAAMQEALDALPADALSPVEEPAAEVYQPPAPVDNTPLMEGFESTCLAPRERARQQQATPMAEANNDFVYSTCPSCQTPQPDPVPKLCDNCGNRLRFKTKSGNEGESIKCRECGVTNPHGTIHCTNCGMKIGT